MMQKSTRKKRANNENVTVVQSKKNKFYIVIDEDTVSTPESNSIQNTNHNLAHSLVGNPGSLLNLVPTPILPKPVVSISANSLVTLLSNDVRSSAPVPVASRSSSNLISKPIKITGLEKFTQNQLYDMMVRAMNTMEPGRNHEDFRFALDKFKDIMPKDAKNKLWVSIVDIIRYIFDNNVGQARLNNFRFYKVPELEYWNRHRRSLWLFGEPGLGKTSFAMTLFKNPLVVYKLIDMKKFLKYSYDGIIFKNISFLNRQDNVQRHLLGVETGGYVKIPYNSISLPSGTPRVFTSSTKIFDISDLGIRWRIHFIRVNRDLKDTRSQTEIAKELDIYIHTDKFHPPADL
ncbi:hypothetical protein AYI69_g8497 [Smittium culicis]|uniref:Uncharacterized protein n=1 Tax=Smittium culicis TaxID=133412 RepID=A0A1R1XJ40_9FUNG|nr:hypothetical protein AYI69_g8497 [Smittium culicis]